MSDDVTLLKKVLKRERESRQLAEKLLEDKSRELYDKNQDLESSNQALSSTLEKLERKQVQLLQSAKLAAVGQLAAGMAHEINNPLGFIRSNFNSLIAYTQDFLVLTNKFRSGTFTDLEAEKSFREATDAMDVEFLAEDIVALTNESNEGLQRIADIASAFIAFSEQGEQKQQLGDLTACLAEVYSEQKNITEKKNIKLSINIAEEKLPEITFDFLKMKQAFSAIVCNAIDFCDASKTESAINLEATCTNTHIQVKITDNGIGIEKEKLARILEPFFTTKPIGAGLGLGLFIAHLVFQKHAGDLVVVSELGKGTEVAVTVPIVHE